MTAGVQQSPPSAAAVDGITWVCPDCRGALSEQASETLACAGCGETFPVVAGIPDLRTGGASWIDQEKDRANARALDRTIRDEGLETALERVFSESRGLPPDKAAYRARQVLAGKDKCAAQLDGWLADALRTPPILDIGSGAGQLLAAAADRGVTVHGVDVSLEWLVVSKHWLEALGSRPALAAALGEALPITDGAVGSVVSLDVLEHVGNQNAFVAEVGRVLGRSGRFAMVTPNRYSAAPEPHVGVWGVGYLPRRFQAGWVGLFSNHSYAYTRLLGVGEARRLFRQALPADARIDFPPIADEEIALFGPRKARLARAYNRFAASRLAAPLLPFVGTYYRITGTKSLPA